MVTSVLAQGEPMLWLTGGGLALACVMIVGLLGLVFYQGFRTFWPQPVLSVTTFDGHTFWGEINRADDFEPDPPLLEGLDARLRAAAAAELALSEGTLHRQMLRTGNFELTA